jgi:hypothetical protein
MPAALYQINHTPVFVVRTFMCAGLAGLKTRPTTERNIILIYGSKDPDYESIYACGALSNKSCSGIRNAYLQVRRVSGFKDPDYDKNAKDRLPRRLKDGSALTIRIVRSSCPLAA